MAAGGVMQQLKTAAEAGEKLSEDEPELRLDQVSERGVDYELTHSNDAPYEMIFGSFIGGYFGGLSRGCGR